MTQEEFERLKAEEKKHLLEIQALKRKVQEVQQKKRIMDAVKGAGMPDSLAATHDEMVGKLTRGALETEVRMDMALENAGIPPVSVPEVDEAKLQEAKAQELVRQMKMEFGAVFPETTATTGFVEPDAGKSIGRKPQDPDAETPQAVPPNRTIGRKKGI